MIYFKDFIPSRTDVGALSSGAKYQSIEDLCTEITDWSEGNPKFSIINIETVMKPINYGSSGLKIVEVDHGDAEAITAYHRPFVRVWYKKV
ncbi:MAG: hypothetical protein AAF487_03020 [Bacteroidota bacterium]